MLDQPTVERLAQRLDDAERSKSLITAFTREYPDLTIEDAYAIQRAWTKLQLSRGRVVRGRVESNDGLRLSLLSTSRRPDRFPSPSAAARPG